MAMALYDALPLAENEIRLLSVSPATDGDNSAPIHCAVKVVSLDDIGPASQYHALSYTWGAPALYGDFVTMVNTRDHPVTCNGHVVQVSKNLYCFLRRLRTLPDLAEETFWIDAICINQDEHEEARKEQADQIQRMGRIYSSAATVVAWLGEQDEYTETAVAMLKRLVVDSDFQRMIRCTSTLSAESAAGLLSVVRLFQRNYFTRGWIIQEIVLAAKVQVLCGGLRIDWKFIADASHMFSTTGFRDYLNGLRMTEAEVNFNTPTVLRAIGRDRVGGHWTNTLLCALIRTRIFKCSDPRDKVYSLLGLVQEDAMSKAPMRPETKVQSATTTYTRTAIQILEEGEDLLLLSCVEGELFQHPSGTETMPSWVPDWREENPLGLRGTGYQRYRAAGQLKQRPVVDHLALTLTLKGIRLDNIAVTGETKHEVIHSEPKSFPGWFEILTSLPVLYQGMRQHADAGGKHRLDAFWRTLIGNHAGNASQMVEEDSPLSGSFAQWFMATRHYQMREMLSDNDLEWLTKASREWTALQESQPHQGFGTIFAHGNHLRLFRTRNGYLGLGSECVKNGDEVWVIPGSRVLLILRTAGDSSQYRLVGGTYLHGFMKGEAVDPQARGKSTEQIEKEMEQVIIV